METNLLIADLRKQKEMLEGLIVEFKGRRFLTRENLKSYDITTHKIKKSLRSLRVFIRTNCKNVGHQDETNIQKGARNEK